MRRQPQRQPREPQKTARHTHFPRGHVHVARLPQPEGACHTRQGLRGNRPRGGSDRKERTSENRARELRRLRYQQAPPEGRRRSRHERARSRA